MNLALYETLTGTTVPASKQTFVTAIIDKIQRKLENLLGYTLDESLVYEDQYTEIGKTGSDCPCSSTVDMDSLELPDTVINSYRVFNYNDKDKYLFIDPCLDVSYIKLIKDGVTYYTLEEEDYRLHRKNGLIKYIELCENCFSNPIFNCECVQLAVDAEWVWADEDDIPNDLLDVFCEMVNYYSDTKKDLKSETLGTHTYTKFDKIAPEELRENVGIIKKYSGPHGLINKNITI